jgi:uncharacterized protein (TIGR01244 family)
MSLPIHRHTADFATAPQLSPEHVPLLAQMGFKTLVNNRPDGEAGPSQATTQAMEEAAKSAGMDYVFYPVVMGQMTEKHATEFAALLSKMQGPVLAYCRTGTRSTYLWQIARAARP